MWALGVGPVGSLVAQGVLNVGDGVLLAEFDNHTNDAALGAAVTDAFREGLWESRVVTLIEAATISEALQRMGRDPGIPLTSPVARALAQREGIRTTVEGDISLRGDDYVVVARIVSVASGVSQAEYSKRVHGDDALMEAIGQLTARIRERVGESLRTIRASESLATMTTGSLDALKRYAEAVRAQKDGDGVRALALLREAVGLDPNFAMAHLKTGVLLLERSASDDQVRAALTLAYENRAQLTQRKRLLTAALYHATVTLDEPAEEGAYREVLTTPPDDPTALNNLGLILERRGELDEAARMLERAISTPNQTRAQYLNLIDVLLEQGLADSAQAVQRMLADRN